LGLFSTIPQSIATNLQDEDLLLYLKYPDDWTVEKVIYTLVFTPPEEYNEIFSIERVTGVEGYSLEQFVNEQTDRLEYEIEDRPRYSIGEPVVDAVGGENAYTVFYAYLSTLEDFTVGGYRTFVIHDNNGYVIDFHTDNEINRSLYLEEVQQILQSIVFFYESNFQSNDENSETREIEELGEENEVQEPMSLVPRTCFDSEGTAYTCMKFQKQE
jgi:hypothetical protein